MKKGPVVIIECPEEIPCNPCETICPSKAIVIGEPITNLPQVLEEKCKGCRLCIPICPGLAIFVVDNTYSANEATVSMPYEFLPLPQEGDAVQGLDRKGKVVCEGKVIKVENPHKNDNTAVITIVIPKKYSNQVRNIRGKYEED